MGSCTVDRKTGLPLQLNRSHYLDLTVMTEAGEIVEQEKRIETTIRTVSQPHGPVVRNGATPATMTASQLSPPLVGPGTIQQTSGTFPTPSDAGTEPGSTTRAVYPD